MLSLLPWKQRIIPNWGRAGFIDEIVTPPRPFASSFLDCDAFAAVCVAIFLDCDVHAAVCVVIFLDFGASAAGCVAILLDCDASAAVCVVIPLDIQIQVQARTQTHLLGAS